MSLIPAFEIGLWNAWLFMGVFLLQWLAVMLAGGRVYQRTGHPPDMQRSKSERRTALATTLTWVVATIYSIFLPLQLGTSWFYIGLGVFLAGLTILIGATLNFATAPPYKPITTGFYRYSRHPMYLAMLLIYIGTSLASASWLFFLLAIAAVVLLQPEARLEERYCLKRYGKAYREYLKKTPRWVGVLKS
ncbi:MAG: isoprenylcysteine carboxylmethyltransferase family protein [Dehalococcoidia bacterium]|nr:MAG: isoprenylcysteine carboxylmethyltransferase family protein [Dehalococcoidia bacterium]